MVRKGCKRNGMWVWLVAWIWGLAIGNALAADPAPGMIIHDGASPVEDEGPIMYVDHINRTIVIKEIHHIVGQFTAANMVYTTHLIDANGKKLDLDRFEKGQWVIVRGYRVGKSIIYLEAVTLLREPFYK